MNEFLVLSDKNLGGQDLPENVVLKCVNIKNLDKYSGDRRVSVIVGSRAMARKSAQLDFPCLKLFQLTSAGSDDVPLDKFAQNGIAVANAGSVYSIPIAETVVFGVLQMAKRFRQNPKNRIFKLCRHYSTIGELAGKKAIILGAGNIGTAVAERLVAFQVQVDGYNLSAVNKAPFSDMISSKEKLLERIGEYDYIICTLPSTDKTRGFVGKDLLQGMKHSAVIVNVGRMAAIDETALYSALKNKKICGAVLDMFEIFPNPLTNKFRRLRNTIVLPGVAAISQEVNTRLAEHIRGNIRAVVENTKVKCIINGVSINGI